MENNEVIKFEYKDTNQPDINPRYLEIEFYDTIYLGHLNCLNILFIVFDGDVDESFLPKTHTQVQLLCDFIFRCFDYKLFNVQVSESGIILCNENFEEFNNWK